MGRSKYFCISKHEDSCDPNSFRPVILNSCFSKFLETIISGNPHPLLEPEGLLGDRQCSVSRDLLAVIFHPRSATFDNHGEVHLVSLDISKIFNKDSHDGLLSNSSSPGLHPALKSWMPCLPRKQTISVPVNRGHLQMLTLPEFCFWTLRFLVIHLLTSA